MSKTGSDVNGVGYINRQNLCNKYH